MPEDLPVTEDVRRTILVIEDDADIARLIERDLVTRRFGVEIARTGGEGLSMARRPGVDAVILDLLLPDVSGLEICQALRRDASTRSIPIVILTALATEADRIRGLELGADDYLTKPFSVRELASRIKALLRRTERRVAQRVAGRVLTVDRERHEVRIMGRPVDLTPTEFAIMDLLVRHPGWVFSRDRLLSALWGEDCFVLEHNLDVHIHALRRKLERDPKHPALLLTVRGVGYKLADGDPP